MFPGTMATGSAGSGRVAATTILDQGFKLAERYLRLVDN
jgi:hypothetical protein